MTDQIELRNQSDAQFFAQNDQPFQFSFIKILIRPDEFRKTLKLKISPWLDYRIIEFVISCNAELLFQIPKWCFRKNAQMYTSESQCRRVQNRALNEEITGNFQGSPLNLCQLAQFDR